MGILVLLVGLLALVSGGFKRWRRSRVPSGALRLATLEVALGAVTIIASGLGVGRFRPLAWTLVAAAFGVVLLSSATHLRAVLAAQRRRSASEGERLRRFVERRGNGER